VYTAPPGSSKSITVELPISQFVVQWVTHAFIHAENMGKGFENMTRYAGKSHAGKRRFNMFLPLSCTLLRSLSAVMLDIISISSLYVLGTSVLLISVATLSANRLKRSRSKAEYDVEMSFSSAPSDPPDPGDVDTM
jgi:hypothetical protein